MRRTARDLALAAGLLCGVPTVAAADRPASQGFYAETGFGATGNLGAARSYAKIGPKMSLRVGYDLWSWLSLGIAVDASSHEATVPPPPVGEWYQLYQGRADARLGTRFDSFALFVEGGAGATYISSNILGQVGVLDPGERFSPVFSGGGGGEYQLQNRHYAFGLAADYWLAPAFDGLQGVEARFYLRYTYGGPR